MATTTTLEERVAALEAIVRDLQRQLALQSQAKSWVDQVTGSFEHEPAFEQVLAHGRAFREADRPPEDPAP